MLNIVKGVDAVTKTVKQCLYVEHCEGGLLEDVKRIVPIHLTDAPKEPPMVWIVQHPTIPYKEHGVLSGVMTLQTTFEFVCLNYNSDLEKADEMAQNLATRVGASILKNWKKINIEPHERVIKNIKFHTLYGGGINISGKKKSVPSVSIIFDFIHDIDWLKCLKDGQEQQKL